MVYTTGASRGHETGASFLDAVSHVALDRPWQFGGFAYALTDLVWPHIGYIGRSSLALGTGLFGTGLERPNA